MPMAAAKPKASRIASGASTVRHSASALMALLPPTPSPMPLAQERADLVLGLGHVLVGTDLDRDRADGARVGLADAEHLLLGRRERDEDHVVLVLAPRALALAAQQADHGEGDLLDADDLADGILVAEEVLRRRLAEQRDLGRAVDVLL